jgi:hypothetical protein
MNSAGSLNVSPNWTQFGPSDFIGILNLDTIHPVGLTMTLNAGGNTSSRSTTFADFSHTASVALVLPDGVTFTSDSGVFLTAVQSPNSVPEPSIWAMLLIGCGGIGATLRRRTTLTV